MPGTAILSFASTVFLAGDSRNYGDYGHRPGTGVTAPMEKNRAFRLLLAGSSVSMLGSRVTTIAYPMLVLHLTGSPFAAGWIAFAATAPSVLFYIPAGALVDRCDPRRTMLFSEFGRGVAIATVVATTLVFGRPHLSLVVVTAVAEGILAVFSAVSEPRYVRSLVEPDQASSALARIEARAHVVVLAGRPLGGFLFGLTPVLPFLADALSFTFSVVPLVSMKSRRAIGQAVMLRSGDLFLALFKAVGLRCRNWLVSIRYRRLAEGKFRSDIRDGLRWLRRDEFARLSVISSAGATLIFQALIIVFIADAHTRRLPSVGIGTVLAASGVGGALGALAASRFRRARANWPWLQIQIWAWAASFAILALSSGKSFTLMAIVMAVLGFTGALGNIEIGTYFIRNVAENMLARANSMSQMMSLGACASGPVLGGILIQEYHIRHTLFMLFFMTMFLAVVPFLGILRSMLARCLKRTDDAAAGNPPLRPSPSSAVAECGPAGAGSP